MSAPDHFTFKVPKKSCYNCDNFWFGPSFNSHGCQKHDFKFAGVVNYKKLSDLEQFVCNDFLREPFLPEEKDEVEAGQDRAAIQPKRDQNGLIIVGSGR